MRRSLIILVLLVAALVLASGGPCIVPRDSSSQSLSEAGIAWAATTPTTPAQDAAHARIGVWRPSDFDSRHAAGWGLTPAQTKTIHDKLRRISDVFRETPVLKSAVGFEVRLFHGIAFSGGGVGKTFATENPPKSGINVNLYDYIQTCETCPIEPAVECTAFIDLTINSIDGFYDTWQRPYAKDREGGIYLAPLRIGELGGYPMFQAPGRAPQVLITRNTTLPIWVPVSQERYIRSRIAGWENTVSNVKPPRDLIGRRAIAELEAELAGLSAGDRAAPAYIASGKRARPSGLGSPDARGARALVSTNPAFFDLSRPKTDFQVAVVSTHRPEILVRKPEYFIGQKLLEAMKTIDWEKVAALIE